MPKLLVVDDDPDMLDLVRAALERDGHQVDTEADAAAVQPGQMQDVRPFAARCNDARGGWLFPLQPYPGEVDCPYCF